MPEAVAMEVRPSSSSLVVQFREKLCFLRTRVSGRTNEFRETDEHMVAKGVRVRVAGQPHPCVEREIEHAYGSNLRRVRRSAQTLIICLP